MKTINTRKKKKEKLCTTTCVKSGIIAFMHVIFSSLIL